MAITFVACWAGAGWAAMSHDITHDYGVQKYHPEGDGPLMHDAVKLKDWNQNRFADEFDLSNYLIDGPITMEIRHRGNGHKKCGVNCCTEKWHFMAYSSTRAGNDPYYNESTRPIPCLDSDIDWLSFSAGKWVTDTFEINPDDVNTAPFRLFLLKKPAVRTNCVLTT